MLNWIKNLRNATPQTQFFAFNWFIYGLVIIITTIYCYVQLNFGTSGPSAKPAAKQNQPPVKIEEKF